MGGGCRGAQLVDTDPHKTTNKTKPSHPLLRANQATAVPMQREPRHSPKPIGDEKHGEQGSTEGVFRGQAGRGEVGQGESWGGTGWEKHSPPLAWWGVCGLGLPHVPAWLHSRTTVHGRQQMSNTHVDKALD
jgi:hypothetical protein